MDAVRAERVDAVHQPTKTPEFLAAGRRLVSTAVVDVVSDYGTHGLVTILRAGDEVAATLRASLAAPPADWLGRVDAQLAGQSWDRTWSEMSQIVERHLRAEPLVSSSQKGG